MRKITLTLLVALSVASVSTFAGDKDKGKKAEKKCTMGSGCCKKTTTKAAMLKTKPAAAPVKKA
jgi:hypothetical protein